jgi:hypothetical protein
MKIFALVSLTFLGISATGAQITIHTAWLVAIMTAR